MTRSPLFRLTLIGAGVLAMAACTRPTPPDAGVPGGGTTPGGTTTYPDRGGGTVGGGPIAAVPGSAEDFAMNTADRIYFDLDSYEIRRDAFPRLDTQVAWLRRYPQVRVRIEGNADERGTREYNLALGARRAEAIRQYLIGNGIPANRIDVISFGKERPIAEGSNEDAWARNRNGHTVVAAGPAPR
jgi:peptidoglycan-associated lipoprotein